MAPERGLRPADYRFTVAREPLVRPFHFKGGFFTEKWLTVTALRAPDGGWATAAGGLAVLWSDPGVFFSRSETGGNLLMALMAEEGARRAALEPAGFAGAWRDPPEALREILPAVHRFGRSITGRPGLRPTFTLNSLVSLDLALWTLLARERGTEELDLLLPQALRLPPAHRRERLLRVPLVTYNTPLSEVESLARGGHSLLKIKLGHPGGAQEMLRMDLERLGRIHAAVRDLPAEHTESGRVLYYLDANGRYPDLETLRRLLDGADRLGLLERVALLEEPFPDDEKGGAEIDVSDLPVRVAADESLHGPEDVRRRADLGYGAVALKPAGKTLSASLEMARAAAQRGLPCFVADSACPPLLVEWNKNVAARLPAFPGLSVGILESNGPQNYLHWPRMVGELPMAGAPWVETRGAVYHLDQEYFRRSGGVFRRPVPYERLLGLIEL